MTTLGSVVGGILAELTRARAVADRVTRQLVAEYQDDPALAEMSVPRVKLSRATVNVRYAVHGVEEPGPVRMDPAQVGIEWQQVAENKIVPQVLHKLQITGDDLRILRQAISIKRPTVGAIEQALQGNTDELLIMTVESALETWLAISTDLQHRLGGKAAFRAEIKAVAVAELGRFLARVARDLITLLASKIQVSVVAADMPDDPHRIQEIQLTVVGEDLELFAFDEKD